MDNFLVSQGFQQGGTISPIKGVTISA